MRLSEKSLRVGGLAMVLAAGAVCAVAQPPQQQQQQVPDAPKPQTLPQLKTITPVAPAAELPSAPAPVLNTTVPAEPAVPSALPSSPQAQTPAAGSQEETPEGMDPGQGVSTVTIRARDVNFVEVPFTVKDNKMKPVPGLTYRDVRVFENGVRQTPRVFTTDPFPLSVALVIDQSVTFDVMKKINESLTALQGAFTPYDEVAVFTYASHVNVQGVGKDGSPFTGAQSARLGVLLERSKGKGREPNMNMGGPMAQGAVINNQAVPSPGGHTGPASNGFAEKEYHTLNDAILAAGQAAARAGKGRRRIVFIISDGKEYGSTAKEKDVIKYLQTNKVAVYATLVGDASIPGMGFLDRVHLPLTMRDNALPRYAAATGGQVDPEFRQGGIERSFAQIAEEVRTQYTVGYYSHEPLLDGKFRKIEVRVLRPGLTVIAKEGYYPAASDSRPLPVTPTAVP